jgi:hypothetical protein
MQRGRMGKVLGSVGRYFARLLGLWVARFLVLLGIAGGGLFIANGMNWVVGVQPVVYPIVFALVCVLFVWANIELVAQSEEAANKQVADARAESAEQMSQVRADSARSLDQLRAEKAALRTHLEAEKAALSAQVTGLSAQVTGLSAQATELSAQVAALSAQRADIRLQLLDSRFLIYKDVKTVSGAAIAVPAITAEGEPRIVQMVAKFEAENVGFERGEFVWAVQKIAVPPPFHDGAQSKSRLVYGQIDYAFTNLEGRGRVIALRFELLLTVDPTDPKLLPKLLVKLPYTVTLTYYTKRIGGESEKRTVEISGTFRSLLEGLAEYWLEQGHLDLRTMAALFLAEG